MIKTTLIALALISLWALPLMGADPATPPSPVAPTPAWASAIGDDRYGHWADLSVKGVTQRMRWCPPGSFTMGCSAEEAEWAYAEWTKVGWTGPKQEWLASAPAHFVTLTTGFWLADTSCTQQMWQAVMGSNPSAFTTAETLPVEVVSFAEVQSFLRTAHMRCRATLTLPSEAQWEYACRAGTTTRFWSGDDPEMQVRYGQVADPDHTTIYNNDPRFPFFTGHDGLIETAPVKSFPPNPWGLYDLHGNVLQWCADWYANYSTTSATDPSGPPAGSLRTVRGGLWIQSASFCRSAGRGYLDPGTQSKFLGFRFLALTGDTTAVGATQKRADAKDTTFESTKKWRIKSAMLKSMMSRPEGGTHVVVGPSAAPEARLPSSP